ncbi:cupin domain-containing protein [Chryseobacterium sp. B21-037]|uniref:cupin domain-containing protein n=1 Tax=Chryseobacterium sp. B21-037 TaxID=2926038 RepID=UPI002358715F|nr:cupin domain-containing protein [Chryseobacterium sp. B21-037]MDC8104619.1 cupin domain-containing protein [Chryseobacterium sp. B21-037]
MATTRRGFLSAVSLSSFGLVTASTGLDLLIPKKAETSVKNGSNGPKVEELEDFVYDIENGSKGWVGPGGTAKEATVEEFPVSQSIAGVIMRLNPGSFRELHWHSIAAEWAYVLEGSVRTTVVAPDGTTATDDFEKGDIWYFPKGHGHCLQCIGDQSCLFLLVFDNGHFSEFGTFSSTDWINHLSPEILARNSGLPANAFASSPHKELYIGTGKIATAKKPQNIDPNIPPSYAAHKFRMETDGVYEKYPGGSTIKVSAQEFPIQKTLTALRMDIEPGAIRELHWHPNADEWQYVMSGQGNLSIFGSHGRVKTMPYKKGMVSFIKQGFGHYIENTGTETLKLIIVFNSDEYQDISLNDWLASNPAQLVEDHFGITPAQTAKIANHKKGIF